MSILQFAFGNDRSARDFQPHNHPVERVVYTGTHDNGTTVGWWNSAGGGDSTRSAADIAREKERAMQCLGTVGRDMHWTLMRAARASRRTRPRPTSSSPTVYVIERMSGTVPRFDVDGVGRGERDAPSAR